MKWSFNFPKPWSQRDLDDLDTQSSKTTTRQQQPNCTCTKQCPQSTSIQTHLSMLYYIYILIHICNSYIAKYYSTKPTWQTGTVSHQHSDFGNTAAQEFVRNLTVSFPRNVLAMMGHFDANLAATCVPYWAWVKHHRQHVKKNSPKMCLSSPCFTWFVDFTVFGDRIFTSQLHDHLPSLQVYSH